ncbi:uncharacterized protein LOC128737052 [Sabethes cyaneus]|uniref:uncharacterized protein LOC128737052 n=1 Tax=Sabethes cyaneus TaxID=53552 RepID=UPI00237E51E9|nr:uncharacterized protein LOC128737052 [Sabethes cyaneus]
MNENLLKICRICLTEGSRHIFQKSVRPDALYNVSSLNRISEKLRYVTLLKIDEAENLPPMICDLCIVQLNVAYNFKRQATESDTKLRQYLIENGIDIMKDPLSFQSNRVSNAPVTGRAIESNRVNQRVNSVSSSVLEVSANQTIPTVPTEETRLLPIRIKVENSDTVEQLSNSTISPLSTVTINAQANDNLRTAAATCGNSAEKQVVDSSPSSSKGSFASSGRDSTMVVVDSRNVSQQGDEDYVQAFLGSTSTVDSCESKVLGPVNENCKDAKETSEDDKKVLLIESSEDGNNQNPKCKPSKRMQSILSQLTIDMVNGALFPKSKLRANARNKQQEDKIKQKKPEVANLSYPATRRHSLELFPRIGSEKKKTNFLVLAQSPSSRKRLSDSSLISPSKLRSLREKIREERGKRQEHATTGGAGADHTGESDSKRRRNATPSFRSWVSSGSSADKVRLS